MKSKKVCLVCSCGGHFMELLQLLPAVEEHDFYFVTEKNKSSIQILKKYRHYFLLQQERNKLFKFMFRFSLNILMSLIFLLKENPDVILTTGAGAAYPTCKIGKVLGKRIIYVESFAKLTNASVTGKKIYSFADEFFVQWEEMKNVYPKSKYHGTVY